MFPDNIIEAAFKQYKTDRVVVLHAENISSGKRVGRFIHNSVILCDRVRRVFSASGIPGLVWRKFGILALL